MTAQPQQQIINHMDVKAKQLENKYKAKLESLPDEDVQIELTKSGIKLPKKVKKTKEIMIQALLDHWFHDPMQPDDVIGEYVDEFKKRQHIEAFKAADPATETDEHALKVCAAIEHYLENHPDDVEWENSRFGVQYTYGYHNTPYIIYPSEGLRVSDAATPVVGTGPWYNFGVHFHRNKKHDKVRWDTPRLQRGCSEYYDGPGVDYAWDRIRTTGAFRALIRRGRGAITAHISDYNQYHEYESYDQNNKYQNLDYADLNYLYSPDTATNNYLNARYDGNNIESTEFVLGIGLLLLGVLSIIAICLILGCFVGSCISYFVGSPQKSSNIPNTKYRAIDADVSEQEQVNVAYKLKINDLKSN